MQKQNELVEKLNCTDEEQEYVINREGTEKGIVIEPTEDFCDLESCTGTVLIVKWDNGEVTECCTHGMNALTENVWQII